ncbi:hypothetical protein MNBD_PLANCTO03-1690 [hydrothermal vent metagenome]|uniref:CBS domain-containing protein n=1 Tax=hydrothermal vent metagenome TaxID=652676 RepID=A0A3B1DMU1_9ZZZZ
MKGTLHLLRVFGIDIAVHWSFLLLIVWIVYRSAAQGVGMVATLVAIVFVLTIFACIVLHELGHALTAKAFGIGTRHITILPIGGVAALERVPTQPGQEFLITIAGPAVNVVIGVGLLGGVLLVGDLDMPATTYSMAGTGFFLSLGVVNIALAIFNMLPAFPMDGGRVLRAVLATRLDYARATAIAAGCGQMMAVAFAAWALLGGNPFLLLIAAFVFFGSKAEVAAARQRAVLTRQRVGAAMQTDIHALPVDAAIGEAAQIMLEGSQHDFPVLDAEGRLVGLLRREAIVEGMRSLGPNAPISARVETDLPVLDENDDLAHALDMLRTHGPALAVMHQGRLVGLLSQEQLGRFLMLGGAPGR